MNVRYYLGGAFHTMACRTAGPADGPVVVCVHGLSRNAHDFDVLAEALADRWRVVAPDLPGRGASGWLHDPALYQPIHYVTALTHLLARMDGPVDWIGTSLGGICGMLVAAAAGSPVRRLVLNDIGPFVPAAAIARVNEYVGAMPTFAGIGEAEDYVRRVHGAFRPMTEAQWRRMAETSTRRTPDGRLALHYDPALTKPLLEQPARDTKMWPYWEKIACPVLVVRGSDSDLLLPETLDDMLKRPGTEAHEVAGAGHAPSLMDAPTIGRIRAFLERVQADHVRLNPL